MDKDQLIEFLLLEVYALSGEVRRLSACVEELERQNKALSAENATLRHENAFQWQDVDDLKSRLDGTTIIAIAPCRATVTA